MAFRSGPENLMEIAISAHWILKVPTYFPVLKVSKFQKHFIVLISNEKRMKLFFDYCPSLLEWVESKNEGSLSH